MKEEKKKTKNPEKEKHEGEYTDRISGYIFVTT
jgi:hypothetical protein